MRLNRVHSGKYQTIDGRFTVTRKHFFSNVWWLVEDVQGRIKDSFTEADTLKEAKDNIELWLSDYENAKPRELAERS